MKRRTTALILCLALALTALLPLSGCGVSAKAEDLMGGFTARAAGADGRLTAEGAESVTDFAVRLFKAGCGDENALVSPVSVIFALAMTANGARGETLSQMESVLGMPIAELNDCLRAYSGSLSSGEKCKVSLANSIWLRDADSFTANPDFLQTNADCYGADVYKAPFDRSTVGDINGWIKEKTDGMIDGALGEISDYAVMYLINALAFDAEWQSIYQRTQVRGGVFTTEGGDTRDVELMYGSEYSYIECGDAIGFLKYYSGGKYAFAALLPDEGVALDTYIASLTGEGLSEALGNISGEEVKTAVPKFKSEFSADMNDILTGMGMTDAFDIGLADFSGLGKSSDGNIFISSVIHKTFIEVNERGTKAGAVTIVAPGAGAAQPSQPKEVYLDRPFIYLLIDCDTNLPLFIGAVRDIGK